MTVKIFCPNCGSNVQTKTCTYCGHVCEIEFTYIEKFWVWFWKEKWYQNPLIVAFVGSIIVAAAQFTAAYTQIYMSSDASDFSINVDAINYKIYKDDLLRDLYKLNGTGLFYIKSDEENAVNFTDFEIGFRNATIIREEQYIKIKDLHSYLRPYQQSVYLTTGKIPKGIEIDIIPSLRTIPPFEAKMYIYFTNELEIGDYNITIEGIGGDGKRRYCKIFIEVRECYTGAFAGYFRQLGLMDYNASWGVPINNEAYIEFQ